MASSHRLFALGGVAMFNDIIASKPDVGGDAAVQKSPVSSTGVSHPLSRARHALVCAEAVAVLCAAAVAKVAYIDFVLGTKHGLLPFAPVAVGLAVVMYLAHKQMGLYETSHLVSPHLGLGKLLGGLAISFAIVVGVLYLTKQSSAVSRGWLVSWFALSVVFLLPVRMLVARQVRLKMESGRLRQRIAIIGTDDYSRSLVAEMRQNSSRADEIDVYSISPDALSDKFAASVTSLRNQMAMRPYDLVIVAMSPERVEEIRLAVKSLGSFTTELLLCTELESLPVSAVGVRHFGSIRADVVHAVPGSETSWLLKRALDASVALVALVLLAPLFAVIALAIKLDSAGPVFFRQRRQGQNNAIFRIFKFRSMTVAEDGPVVVQAVRHDSRVTRVGRFLRSTSLDELPQLINVLLGDMSLVGPRPHAIAHDDEFERTFDLFSRRRRVKPGITGWAQINGYRGETKTAEDIQRRMEYDLYYIDHWSIWFDLEILVRTLFVFAKGAY